MQLENGRDLTRGILLLVFAALAYWADLELGLILSVAMGLLIFQSAFTDWCPADPFLRLLGMKRKSTRGENMSPESQPPTR